MDHPVADQQSTFCPAGRPTLRDIALLNAESDYSAFVAAGVDRTVHRAAMKKLFSDPHFNVMDGLDIYIDDYTKPSPLSASMLAALQHAKSTLDPQPFRADEEPEASQEAPPPESVEATDASGAPIDSAAPDNAAADDMAVPPRDPPLQAELPDPS
jgi:hypothetical protein